MAMKRRRAGGRLRERARSEARLALRANRFVIAVSGLIAICTFGAVIGLMTLIQTWTAQGAWWNSSFQRGFLLGAVLLGVLWYGTEVFRAVTESAERLRKGATGEELTAGALKWLRLRRWHVLHDLEWPREFNVDHVVIGPGGVLAVESKYTTQDWKVHSRGLQGPFGDPLKDATRGARRVSKVLEGAGIAVEVVACLVIWGPGAPSIEEGRTVVRDVRVLEGRRQRVWRSQILRRPRVLDRSAIKAARDALSLQRS